MASKLATFRTDSDIWENFQAKAKTNGTNASALLQSYLRDYLDNRIDSNLDKAPINHDIDNSMDSRIDAALESKLDACIDERLDNKLESILQRVASLENAIATSTSEATAPAKKPTESDNQEPEVLPIIDTIKAANTAPDDLQTIESLAIKFDIPFNLTVPTLKKIYVRLVAKSSDRLIDPSKASKSDFIKAFKELGYT